MIERTFEVSGPAHLDCTTVAGAVVIEGGTAGTVQVRIDTSNPAAWKLTQNGNRVSVSNEARSWTSGGRANVVVLLPPDSDIAIKSATAEILVKTDVTRATISTASGDIRVHEANELGVKTASGDVAVGAVASDLTVKSASGDVRADRVDGDLSVVSASGDVKVGQCHGRLVGSSASGDIRVDAYLGDNVELTTMSGDVSIGLPSGISVELKAKTLSGEVRLPPSRQQAQGGKRRVDVSLSSISGDLRINRLD